MATAKKKAPAIDLEADAATPEVSQATLAQLKKLVDEQLRIEKALEEANAKVKALQDSLRNITEQHIPNFFDTLGGVKFLGLTDGSIVTVAEEVYPSIKKDNQPKAFKWLREHEFGDLIKNEVKVSFGAGEDERAEKLIMLLVQKKYTSFEQKESIHAQTLGAFVREQLKKGADLPSEIDIQRVRKSVIKKPKA